MGERCHFAHGAQDLRAPNKPNTLVCPGGVVGAASNFKTVPCKYFTQDGICNFGDKCSYAHGVKDMRAKQLVPYSHQPAYEYDERGVLKIATSQDEVVLK